MNIYTSFYCRCKLDHASQECPTGKLRTASKSSSASTTATSSSSVLVVAGGCEHLYQVLCLVVALVMTMTLITMPII